MRRLIWVAATVTLAAGAPSAAHAAATADFFTFPSEIVSNDWGLGVAGDGTVYFGGNTSRFDSPVLGRVDPAAVVPETANGITSVATPRNENTGSSAAIRGIAFAPKSNLVFFSRSDGVVGSWDGASVRTNTIGRVNGTGAGAALWGIAPAADGGAWVAEWAEDNSAEYRGNRIAYVGPQLDVNQKANLAFQTGAYDSHRYGAHPRAMTVAPDGKPWFTESEGGQYGYRIGTWDGKYTEYDPVCPPPPDPNVPDTRPPNCSHQSTGDGLEGITAAADGTLWYANQRTLAVGHLVPGTTTAAETALTGIDPTLSGAKPQNLSTAPDGSILLAVSGSATSNAIIRINPTTLKTEVYKVGARIKPLSVVGDSKGNAWFIGGGAAAIGRLTGIGGTITAPPTDNGTPSTPISQPATQPTTVTTLVPTTVAKATITDPTVKADSVSANQLCVGPPQDKCSLIYLIQTHEYVTGFPGVKGSAAKVKTFTIGKKSVTLNGGQKAKVTVKLNKLGQKLYKKKKHFKATLTVTQAVKDSKKPKTVLKKNVTFKR